MPFFNPTPIGDVCGVTIYAQKSHLKNRFIYCIEYTPTLDWKDQILIGFGMNQEIPDFLTDEEYKIIQNFCIAHSNLSH